MTDFLKCLRHIFANIKQIIRCVSSHFLYPWFYCIVLLTQSYSFSYYRLPNERLGPGVSHKQKETLFHLSFILIIRPDWNSGLGRKGLLRAVNISCLLAGRCAEFVCATTCPTCKPAESDYVFAMHILLYIILRFCHGHYRMTCAA